MKKLTFPIALALCMPFVFGSCAKKIYFNNSSVEPAAVGVVKVKKDNNHNYAIDLLVRHLASPTRLTPSKDTYVVWMETAGNGDKNVGRMSIRSGILSKDLKGSLKTVTSFRPTKFFITAETDGNIHEPGTQIVMTTEPFN